MTGVPATIRASALACTCIALSLGGSLGRHAVANEPVAATSSRAERESIQATSSSAKPAAGASASCGAGAGCAAHQNTDSGIARSSGPFKIGARVDPQELHVVTRPGLYGVGHPPRGNSYGVVNGRLIRFNPDTMQVLSVIRDIDQILD